jgi:integrase
MVLLSGFYERKGKKKVVEPENNNNNPTKIQNYEDDILALYLFALKLPVTKDKYTRRLEQFFDFVNVEGKSLEEKSSNFISQHNKEGDQWVFNLILKFVLFHLERVNRKEITGSTLQNYIKSIKLFCEIADISIKWSKIRRGLPKGRSYADDRIPTIDEIQKLLEYPDRRIKAIIYTMISSGIRLGAWDYLKVGHVRPIKQGTDNDIVAAKIVVYSGEDEEYFSFITSEAYHAIQEWLRYRQSCGENIDENSWLMRDLWDTSVPQVRGLITMPRKLKSSGIKRLIERGLIAQGLRKKLENGKKRHPYQAVHSFRKWFKTQCELGGMKPINVEKLLSHSIGISNSYYRPTENDLLKDYLGAVEILSLDKEHKLKKQLSEYKQKSLQDGYLIKGKLLEKDELLHQMQEQHQIDIDRLRTEMEARFQQLFSKIDFSELR